MCSAECTLCPNTADCKNSTYYALADITLLHFDVRAFAHTYMLRALRVPRRSRVNAIVNCDVELFCSTPRVPWRQQPARPRIKVTKISFKV